MFSRGSRSALPVDGQLSFIGAEVVVSGDIRAEGGLHIDGKVNGDIRCARLSQGPGGEVHGNIFADEARLAGLVDGAVEAGALTLEASARVTGDVIYESLSVARGGAVEGRFRRRRPDDHGSIAARQEQAEAPVGLFAAAPSENVPVAAAAE
jgi:cytoskeletal protein CcmA (bactofilin family)